MNLLEFTRGGTAYTLNRDGTLTARSNGTHVGGSWTSKSAVDRNELTLTPTGQAPVVVPVSYSFVIDSEKDLRNVLKIAVRAEADGAESSALFAGQIVIDDRRDIEYRVRDGIPLFIYGNLAFSDSFQSLDIKFADGGEARIRGRAGLSEVTNTTILTEKDLLTFRTSTTWIDPDGSFQGNNAEIKLSGQINPENGQLKFFGSFEGNKTFNVALAGRYKVGAAAIEVCGTEDGDFEAHLTVASAITSFRGISGQFGVSIGYSSTDDLSLTAVIRFASDATDQEGNSRIQGGARFELAGGTISASVDLKGTFVMKQNRILVFELEAGVTNSKLELAIKGTYKINANSELSFQVGYANSQAVIKLAYKSEKLAVAIQIAAGESGLTASFSVTLTFGADGTPEVGGPVRDGTGQTAVLSSGTPAAVSTATPAVPELVEITPETLSTYPRTSSGCSNDFKLLHPVVRRMVTKLQTRLHVEGIPLFVFEAFRSPQRQNDLFNKVPKVTNAKAWQSYHQYGLAVDFVFHQQEYGGWHWGKNNLHTQWYRTLHKYAREIGLEPLSWETPHLQPAGLELSDLQKGRFPAGGDTSWGMNLADVIASWNGAPPAPPPPTGFSNIERPPLDGQNVRRLFGNADLDGAATFHSRYNGVEWKVDVTGQAKGIITKGKSKPERTNGEPVTCRKILSLYGDLITKYALRYDLPEELIVMTIATESAVYRDVAYTGPRTFRWEPHIGEYSAGPMQTLSNTVRELIERYNLPYSPNQIAPKYPHKPDPVPSTHALFDPEVNIELGTLEIHHRLGTTGYDPILVAAAYNAGGLYPTEANRWHLRSHGDHLDRAARWFGDVFAV
jgi:peptidoglycan L-alanyl-D-glutamate endopeptidase CwlK